MAFIDFESLSLDGKPVIRILPEKKERHYFTDGPKEVSFECPFDATTEKFTQQLMKAVMLPERKFVRWRGKKMLVSKTHPRPVTMHVNFDIASVLNRLGLK